MVTYQDQESTACKNEEEQPYQPFQMNSPQNNTNKIY